MSRRPFVQMLSAAPAMGGVASRPLAKHRRIAVIGAGAFGGWTALHLLRSGAEVTLIDAWGPGNSRASSGGESRVIRHAYEARRYVDMVARSIEIWKENQHRWGRRLLHQTGALFMGPHSEPFGRDAQAHLEAAGVPFEIWDGERIARTYPQMNPDGLDWGIWEPSAGYLRARDGCRAVADAFLEEGGTFRVAQAMPGTRSGGELQGIQLSDGSTLTADRYVFACGPWMGRDFPDVIGELIRPTRQEVFFFGQPVGDHSYSQANFPVWADVGPRMWYGIPGREGRGFKVADDTRGASFDPTDGERRASETGLREAREYLEHRFPGMRGAPLLEARVCQYEQTPDADFIVDRHPEAENLWLVGGGSGHGYKHGAALGEYAAQLLVDDRAPEPVYSLSRFE